MESMSLSRDLTLSRHLFGYLNPRTEVFDRLVTLVVCVKFVIVVAGYSMT